MKKLTALCAASLLCCTQVSAQSYFDELLIFGDSLMDSGNLGLRFTNRVGDGSGNFSTGAYAEIAPQHLGKALGLATNSAVGGGTSYAVGGYETADILNSINGTGLALPAGGAVARAAYLTEFPRINPNALILIDGGGNDFLNGTANSQATIIASAQTLVGAVKALSNAGGRYIMLSNLPDLGKTAAAQAQNFLTPGYAAAVSTGAAGFNQAVQTYANLSGANIIPVDLAGLIAYVSNNAEAYGFANGSNAAFGPLANFDQRYMCFDDGPSNNACIEHPVYGISQPTADPSKLLFNDGVHPTAKLGEITGDYLIDVVTAPQVVGQVPSLGLGIARTQQQSLVQVMRENRWLADGDRLFISASGATGDEPTGGDQESKHLTLGLSRAVSPGLSLGAAISMADHELNTDGSEIAATSVGFSGLVNYREDRWLAEGSVGLNVVDYSDIDRKFSLGSQNLTAAGGADGHGWHLDGQLAYNMLSSQTVSLAPALGLRWLNSKVDGYTESGGAVSNYQWGEQSRASRQFRLGMLANAALSENFSLYAEAFAVSEEEDANETIEIRNTNLGYTSYRLPSYQNDGDSFADVSLGAALSVDKARVALNLNYNDEGEGRESVMLNYSRPF
ncbi:MAG: SGNH/GDSL hydrolase family protein [Zhongshania sp.]|uniref:autotransporter domain-containing protein n=1 Tax=Zhongshania sp. TaxID=1971902 RepID=UPI002626624D|nr:autotransporter domain-containing protein [Zhongshania sp.]MDF1693110.1 SGNH/GDSL hydrolase family protein [Zhongshania sp.]